MHWFDSCPQGDKKNVQQHKSCHYQEQMLVTDYLEKYQVTSIRCNW